MQRAFVGDLKNSIGQEIKIKGWVLRLRALAKTTFVVLKDCTGTVQCVAATDRVKDLHLKLDDAVEIIGRVRAEPRSKQGFEVDILEANLVGSASNLLPFNSSSDISEVGSDVLLEYRPLAIRNDKVGDVFKLQAALVRYFREFLTDHHFTEIITSKIVGSGTEGGTNLFEIKYFDRVAYLAQSPQFYKEHGVAALERVYETGHVYRAEPHATSRHLTEYYSLDLEMGFVDGPEDVIQLEKELLSSIFEKLNTHYSDLLQRHGRGPLPSMLGAPTWHFSECMDRLKREYERADLVDDLDPEAERQLCKLAEKECGIPAVFVLGFPLAARPFYTHPLGTTGGAASFDLLFEGLEITTGGQRLHRRADLETSLRQRGIDPASFEGHLRMFDLGMPPHGGLALGLERLTAQILKLQNVREATMYPRDRFRISP